MERVPRGTSHAARRHDSKQAYAAILPAFESVGGQVQHPEARTQKTPTNLEKDLLRESFVVHHLESLAGLRPRDDVARFLGEDVVELHREASTRGRARTCPIRAQK